MEMLHPSDGSLIGLCSISNQTEVSVVCDRKTESYSILFGPSLSRCRIPVISKAYKKTAGDFLEEKQLIGALGYKCSQNTDVI
jgi:hypothetical protein